MVVSTMGRSMFHVFNPERVCASANAFSVHLLFDVGDPGLSLRSNPGLELANAFGVPAALELANAFGVPAALELANAFGVPAALELANAFGVPAGPELANAFGVFSN